MRKLTVALAVAGALAGSTAATAAAPSVTLQADRDTITFGGNVSLTGQVRAVPGVVREVGSMLVEHRLAVAHPPLVRHEPEQLPPQVGGDGHG